MTSPKNRADLPVSEKRIRNFLVDLANLWLGTSVQQMIDPQGVISRSDSPTRRPPPGQAVQMLVSEGIGSIKAAHRFHNSYPDFLPRDFFQNSPMVRSYAELVGPDFIEGEWDAAVLLGVLVLSRRLKAAWSDQDPRNKLWRSFLLRLDYHRATGGNLDDAPPLTPFELAIQYFQDNWTLTRTCQRAGCVAPYFFRKDRDAKYCGSECSAWATKKSRLAWYHRNKAKGSNPRKAGKHAAK
jgi:hypothetical protein